MLTTASKDLLVALVLIAPFVAIYALVFVYPTAQMFLISFTDAPLIGEGNWVWLDNYRRLYKRPDVQESGMEYRLFRADDGHPRDAHFAHDCCWRISPQRQGSGVHPCSVLSSVHPARLGSISDLGLDAELPVRNCHARIRLARHPARPYLQIPHLVHAGRCVGDYMVDGRLLDPAVSCRTSRHSRRNLRSCRARQCLSLDDFPPHNLAAALAGHLSGLNHSAHSAA